MGKDSRLLVQLNQEVETTVRGRVGRYGKHVATCILLKKDALMHSSQFFGGVMK